MPKMTILTITFLGLFIEVLGMFEMFGFTLIFSGLFIEVFGSLGNYKMGKMTKFGEIGI